MSVQAPLSVPGTGVVTVTVTVALLLPDVAVIVACPAPIAVTLPLLVTAADAPLLELHVTVAPLMTAPLASFTTAVSCCAAADRERQWRRGDGDARRDGSRGGDGDGGRPLSCHPRSR